MFRGPNPGRGRPKGRKNNATLERDAMRWAAEFFKSDEYLASAQARVLKGKAPHLEGYWLPRMHGKAPESIQLTGPDRGPIEIRIVRVG